MRNVSVFVVAALLGLTACGGKSGDGPVDPPVDPPQVPVTMEAEPYGGQGVVGRTISTSPAVAVLDAQRKAVAGVFVRFTANSGGRVANDSARTNSFGIATSGSWTLGTTAGVQSIVATSAGLSTITFIAQATADAAQRVVAVFTNTQQGVVNGPTALAPSIRAFDQFNNVVPGVFVNFTVVSGGGSIAGALKITGADGIATADVWTLGTTPGPQQVRATAPDVGVNVLFSAVAMAGAPQKMITQGGNAGSGVSGLPLESYGALPSVLVTDAFNNPLSGVSVTFTPGANSGLVTGSPALTNAQGIATPSSWVLGNVASQTLTATSAAIPGAQVVFTVSALVTSFDITVRYVGIAPTARQQLAVSRAVTKWRSVIVGRSGTSLVKMDVQGCGENWMPAVDETVTNLLIFAHFAPIDGVGNIAGNAGPCLLHNSSGLPSLGTMNFDSADLPVLESSGLIDDVILHEMGHALGFGVLWTTLNLITDRGGADPIFTGASARQQFATLFSSYAGRQVPLENSGSSASLTGHWRESVLRNELMTSAIGSGVNPLSRMTVGAMKDIGYDVSFLAADAFTPSIMFMSSVSPFAAATSNDVHATPLFTTDRQGRLSRWTPPLR